MKYLILKLANGRSVRNLQELRAILKESPVIQAGSEFARFTFQLDGGEIVLPVNKIDAANQRIRRQYNIADQSGLLN